MVDVFNVTNRMGTIKMNKESAQVVLKDARNVTRKLTAQVVNQATII